MLPNMSLQTSSTASSDAKGTSSGNFDNSGFVVNFGPGTAVASGLPSWLIIAAVVGGAVWLMRKH